MEFPHIAASFVLAASRERLTLSKSILLMERATRAFVFFHGRDLPGGDPCGDGVQHLFHKAGRFLSQCQPLLGGQNLDKRLGDFRRQVRPLRLVIPPGNLLPADANRIRATLFPPNSTSWLIESVVSMASMLRYGPDPRMFSTSKPISGFGISPACRILASRIALPRKMTQDRIPGERMFKCLAKGGLPGGVRAHPNGGRYDDAGTMAVPAIAASDKRDILIQYLRKETSPPTERPRQEDGEMGNGKLRPPSTMETVTRSGTERGLVRRTTGWVWIEVGSGGNGGQDTGETKGIMDQDPSTHSPAGRATGLHFPSEEDPAVAYKETIKEVIGKPRQELQELPGRSLPS